MNILFPIYISGLALALILTCFHALIFEEFSKWHARIMFVSLVWPMTVPYLGVKAVVWVFKGTEWLWERAEFPVPKSSRLKGRIK